MSPASRVRMRLRVSARARLRVLAKRLRYRSLTCPAAVLRAPARPQRHHQHHVGRLLHPHTAASTAHAGTASTTWRWFTKAARPGAAWPTPPVSAACRNVDVQRGSARLVRMMCPSVFRHASVRMTDTNLADCCRSARCSERLQTAPAAVRRERAGVSAAAVAAVGRQRTYTP